MSIRNIVKVMNFHALIRVDHARRMAEKYRMMEDQLYRMMDTIMNNKNLNLDKKVMTADPDAPRIDIFIGSDFGFCSNYNSQINERLGKASSEDEKVIIGRKLVGHSAQNVVIRMDSAEFEDKIQEIGQMLEDKIQTRTCSSIHLYYNHYENTTSIYARDLQLFPIDREFDGESGGHDEDFVTEGNINRLMVRLISAYIRYELMLAAINTRAAENILRQNATTESLKKIDEIEEEKLMQSRRDKRNKEFQKVVDNFTKIKMYGGA